MGEHSIAILDQTSQMKHMLAMTADKQDAAAAQIQAGAIGDAITEVIRRAQMARQSGLIGAILSAKLGNFSMCAQQLLLEPL
jgi:hypothetical protein